MFWSVILRTPAGAVLVWLVAVAAALPVFGQASPVSGQKDAPRNFVGSDACKTCHADVWSKFYKNPHFKSVASGTEKPDHTGCEGCHGPGGAHVAAGGGKATIVAFSELPALPCADAIAGKYSALVAHAKRRGVHQLPFDP